MYLVIVFLCKQLGGFKLVISETELGYCKFVTSELPSRMMGRYYNS
jgi:hypothetical protein